MPKSPFWIALLSALLFGAATPFSKVLLTHLTPYQLAGFLYLGAAVGVLGIIIRTKTFLVPWRMDRKNQLRLLGAVTFGGVLGPLALLVGLNLASASSVSMWLNLEMVATVILGHLVFKDHLTRNGWIAAGIILSAAVLLAAGEGAAGLKAGLLVALACLCWGIDNHLTALIDGISPAQSTFWKGLVAGSTNLFIGILLSPMVASPAIMAGSLALGAVAYGLSISLYILSAQQLGASRSQLIFSSAPFWGVLLSVILLAETIHLRHWIAALMFVAAITLLFREQHLHAHHHAEHAHDHLHTHDDGHHTHSHGNEPIEGFHAHSHTHLAFDHAHAHLPDLHHRHNHDNEPTGVA